MNFDLQDFQIENLIILCDGDGFSTNKLGLEAYLTDVGKAEFRRIWDEEPERRHLFDEEPPVSWKEAPR